MVVVRAGSGGGSGSEKRGKRGIFQRARFAAAKELETQNGRRPNGTVGRNGTIGVDTGNVGKGGAGGAGHFGTQGLWAMRAKTEAELMVDPLGLKLDPTGRTCWPLDICAARQEAVDALTTASEMMVVLHGADDSRSAEAQRKLAIAHQQLKKC
jgi:hypothetical protein